VGRNGVSRNCRLHPAADSRVIWPAGLVAHLAVGQLTTDMRLTAGEANSWRVVHSRLAECARLAEPARLAECACLAERTRVAARPPVHVLSLAG
jgi:hypothetical protein